MHFRRNLSDRALDLGMAGMADQHDLATTRGVAAAFIVHLGDQRTGGIQYRKAAAGRQFLHLTRHAVGAEHGAGARRDLIQLVDEDGPARAQVFHHMAVVHDLVTDVDRRAIFLQCPLDNLNRPLDTGAEAARLSQDNA